MLMHTYFESDRDARPRVRIRSAKFEKQMPRLPNQIPIRNDDWFKSHFRKFYLNVDWLKDHFIYPLSFIGCDI